MKNEPNKFNQLNSENFKCSTRYKVKKVMNLK